MGSVEDRIPEGSKTVLQKKIFKIFGFLILIRLGLYIPVPTVELGIFSQEQSSNYLFGLAKNLTGSSFLGIGSLGILPYINSSIVIQLLTSVVPSLKRLQKEEGKLGRQQITRYTRYLTFSLALLLSIGIAFILVKPVVFNWNLILALKIIFSLTTGSMFSMWFAELITNEDLGNGASMIIFINILGGLPANIGDLSAKSGNSPTNNFLVIILGCLIYISIVAIIVLVQDSYKRVNIVSARQLNFNYLEQSYSSSNYEDSYIPVKLNQGGVMPLVFSTTIVTSLLYPLQLKLAAAFSVECGQLTNFLVPLTFILNLVLVIFFSTFYGILILNPKDLSDSLTKWEYNIPGLNQGKETIFYFEEIISRLSFMSGLFLAFLAFFPTLIGNFFQFTIFKNLTSLIILLGVTTDVTSQVNSFRYSVETLSKKD